jgi:hypothetical protein
MTELEARRRILIARCELQRAEMALRVGELKKDPLWRLLGGAFGSAGTRGGTGALKHPLTWIVAIGGLFLLRRPRQILTVLELARSAVSMAAKASVALRLFGQVSRAVSKSPRGEERV